MLVAAGDRPPANGAHVYHSTDGGLTFQDITPAGECEQVGCSHRLASRTKFLHGLSFVQSGLSEFSLCQPLRFAARTELILA